MSITPQRWDQVQALFEDALAQEPARRTAYLQNVCGSDDDLFREVASLLEADGQGHSLLEGHALEGLDVLDLPESLSFEGAQVGPYRVLRLIGEGGMGLVYQAERADGVFEQRVALKLIKRGMDTAQIVRRFEAERQILACLQHEHIARLLDGGVTDDGLPYFAMEYVDGVPIDQYCDTHRLSIDERLDLFVTVCKAVLYAHANLVVHRDLKPENILVTREGTVKLLDFGIAKVLGGDEDQTQLTQVGGRVLTPGYASPEQIRGAAIGTSSDIYSLGVVLYELLAGQRPYVVTGATPEALSQALSTAEPERPSTAVGRTTQDADTQTAETISQARRTQPEKLRRRLSGDLDVICLKALRKEPERRYGTVEAFSEDIRRHRTGLPVLARRDTVGYRVRKFMQRHRAGVAVTAVVVLLITVLVGFYTVRLSQERDRAQGEAEKAQQVSKFLQGIFEVSNPSESKGETVTARELLDKGAEQLEDELADQPDVLATMLDVIGGVYRELGLYDKASSMHRKALLLHKRLYGERHVDVAASLNLLGFARRLQGDYAGADSAYRAALVLQRELLGDEHVDVAESLTNLAVVLRRMGNDDEAEAMVREAVRQRIKLLGPNHMDVAGSMNNLALLLARKSEFKEADSLYQIVTKILQKSVGEVHPGVAITLSNRAYIRGELGDYEEEEALYRAALAVKRKLYDPEHPSLVVSLNNLAATLIGQEQYEEAEPLIGEAIAIGREAYGEEHPEMANALSHLARVLAARQDYAEAEALRREAIRIERAVYGAKHRRVAMSLYGIASLLSEQGKHEEAEAMQRQGVAMSREVSGEEHLHVARDLQGLGHILMQGQKYAAAEPVLREALALRIKLRGEDHVEVARSRSRLAEVLVNTRQFEEAEALLLAALPVFEAQADEHHEDAQQTYEDLIALYEAWGQPDRAASYRTRLVDNSNG